MGCDPTYGCLGITMVANSPGLDRAADFAPAGGRLALDTDSTQRFGMNPRSGLWTVDPDGGHPHLVVPKRSVAYVAW